MLRERFKRQTDEISQSEITKMQSVRKGQVPDGMFRKCSGCRRILYEEDVQKNWHCCPECGKHFRIEPRVRITLTVDADSFREWDEELVGNDPLAFDGYEEKLQRLRESTGIKEAVLTGEALIGGIRTAIGVMSADFLMGSMGTAVGEKITRMIERATKERLPVVLFCCSGGARMQEGIFSLMQMAKTSQALKKHDEAGLLYVPVLTDPTTGGVTASFAMLGDVILAEPDALIGFAGPRVIRQTIGQKLPVGFQSAEFLQKHGFVDRVAGREQMRKTLAVLLRSAERRQDISGVREAAAKTGASGCAASDVEEAAERGVSDGECKEGASVCVETDGEGASGRGASEDDCDAWERVQRARSADRPHTREYIAKVFDGFMELHGDRVFGDDRAVIGGIASIEGQYVTVIGQQKGRGAKENKRRNFGMPNPEGYRKALRLAKQAEKFGRPVIFLVDTPGAFCGIEAEERGQCEAIARNLCELSDLRVPVLSIITGEGGSGGALAFAVANEVWMLENAVYSVLSPEGFAAILWKDGKRAREAAAVMKMTAAELAGAGIIEKVIPEPVSADKDDMEALAADLRREILRFLKRYQETSGEEIARARYQRFRRM